MNDFKLACKLLFKSLGLFFLVILKVCECFFLGLKKIFENMEKSQKKTKKSKSKKKTDFFEEFQNFI